LLSEESRLADAVGASWLARPDPEPTRMSGILARYVSIVHGFKNANRAKKRARITIRRNECCVNTSFTEPLQHLYNRTEVQQIVRERKQCLDLCECEGETNEVLVC